MRQVINFIHFLKILNHFHNFVRVNIKSAKFDATSITNKDLLLIILQFRNKIFSSVRSTDNIDNFRMM